MKLSILQKSGPCTSRRGHSELALWATPGTDIKRGPSHDILELLNPEGIPFKALAPKPDAREHRNFIFGADRVRRAIASVPVLLFGATTLRAI